MFFPRVCDTRYLLFGKSTHDTIFFVNSGRRISLRLGYTILFIHTCQLSVLPCEYVDGTFRSISVGRAAFMPWISFRPRKGGTGTRRRQTPSLLLVVAAESPCQCGVLLFARFRNSCLVLTAALTPNQPGTPNPTARRRCSGPMVYMRTMQVLYMSGYIGAKGDNMPETHRRIRLAWAYYHQLMWELHNFEETLFTLKVSLQKAEVMETLLYGCVTRILSQVHFPDPLSANHNLLLSIIGIQRRQMTDRLIPIAKALKDAQCESVETTTRKRPLLYTTAVQRTTNEGLTNRVMFGTIDRWKKPGLAQPKPNRARCLLADDIRILKAPEGSTDSLSLLLEV